MDMFGKISRALGLAVAVSAACLAARPASYAAAPAGDSHPVLMLTSEGVAAMKDASGTVPRFDAAVDVLLGEAETAVARELCVPVPKDGGGGYTLKAAQTDKRFKAVATLSMFNTGLVRRNGFLDSQINDVQQRLVDACAARQTKTTSVQPFGLHACGLPILCLLQHFNPQFAVTSAL